MFLVRKLSRSKQDNFELTLIAPSTRGYNSGMFSGFLEGIYTESEISFELSLACLAYGVSFVPGSPHRIDLPNKRVFLKDGQMISFDILVLEPESRLTGEDFEGVKKYANLASPFESLKKIKQHFSVRNIGLHITIVGAGICGVELALALNSLLKNRGRKADFTIIDASHSVLRGSDPKTQKIAAAKLKEADMELLLGHKIHRVSEELLYFDDQTVLQYDYLIWATEPVGNPIFKDSGFTVDDKGFPLFNQFLQSVDAPNIFGTGTGVVFSKNNLPRTDIYAFKQVPCLLRNIKRIGAQAKLSNCLSLGHTPHLIALGESKGVWRWGNLVLEGKHGYRVKKRRDSKLIERLTKGLE